MVFENDDSLTLDNIAIEDVKVEQVKKMYIWVAQLSSSGSCKHTWVGRWELGNIERRLIERNVWMKHGMHAFGICMLQCLFVSHVLHLNCYNLTNNLMNSYYLILKSSLVSSSDHYLVTIGHHGQYTSKTSPTRFGDIFLSLNIILQLNFTKK